MVKGKFIRKWLLNHRGDFGVFFTTIRKQSFEPFFVNTFNGLTKISVEVKKSSKSFLVHLYQPRIHVWCEFGQHLFSVLDARYG